MYYNSQLNNNVLELYKSTALEKRTSGVKTVLKPSVHVHVFKWSGTQVLCEACSTCAEVTSVRYRGAPHWGAFL